MSRSNKGSKPPGFDYWGKRGSHDKKTTKKAERAVRRNEISKVTKKVKKEK